MSDEEPTSTDPNRARYEWAIAFGDAQYRDVIERLTGECLPTHFTQTGDMNAALEVMLPGGHVLLISDADDSLSWYRDEQHGWGVGLYTSDDASDGPLRFASAVGHRLHAGATYETALRAPTYPRTHDLGAARYD